MSKSKWDWQDLADRGREKHLERVNKISVAEANSRWELENDYDFVAKINFGQMAADRQAQIDEAYRYVLNGRNKKIYPIKKFVGMTTEIEKSKMKLSDFNGLLAAGALASGLIVLAIFL